VRPRALVCLLQCMSPDVAHRVDIGMSAFAPLSGAKRTRSFMSNALILDRGFGR